MKLLENPIIISDMIKDKIKELISLNNPKPVKKEVQKKPIVKKVVEKKEEIKVEELKIEKKPRKQINRKKIENND